MTRYEMARFLHPMFGLSKDPEKKGGPAFKADQCPHKKVVHVEQVTEEIGADRRASDPIVRIPNFRKRYVPQEMRCELPRNHDWPSGVRDEDAAHRCGDVTWR